MLRCGPRLRQQNCQDTSGVFSSRWIEGLAKLEYLLTFINFLKMLGTPWCVWPGLQFRDKQSEKRAAVVVNQSILRGKKGCITGSSPLSSLLLLLLFAPLLHQLGVRRRGGKHGWKGSINTSWDGVPFFRLCSTPSAHHPPPHLLWHSPSTLPYDPSLEWSGNYASISALCGESVSCVS